MADLTTGLSHHWRFDGDKTDSAASANFAGTETGYTTMAVGQGVQLHSGNLTISDTATLDVNAGTTDFTIAGWSRFAAVGGSVFRFFEKKGGLAAANAGWTSYLTASGNWSVQLADGTNRTLWTTTPTLSADQITHLCFVWDASENTGTMYINAVAVEYATGFDNPDTLGDLSDANGIQLSGSATFEPDYDDLRFYNGRALSAADVAAAYALGQSAGARKRKRKRTRGRKTRNFLLRD